MGAVIVLLPADPETYAIEGGEAPEQLHVTLCYLGEDNLDPATIDALKQALAPVSESYGSIEALISGAGILGEDAAVVLLLESDEIVAVYEQVKAVKDSLGVEVEAFPSYIPHMTLGYPTDMETGDAMVQQALPWVTETIILDQLAILNGEDLHSVELGGTPGSAAEAPVEPGAAYAKRKKRRHWASRAVFANPWHDQIGRFAPKGTGTQAGGETAAQREMRERIENGQDPDDAFREMVENGADPNELDPGTPAAEVRDEPAPLEDRGETAAQREMRERIENGQDPDDAFREMVENGADPNELDPGTPRAAEPSGPAALEENGTVQMIGNDVQASLLWALDPEIGEFDLEAMPVENVVDLQDAGYLTDGDGFVVTYAGGDEFQITVNDADGSITERTHGLKEALQEAAMGDPGQLEAVTAGIQTVETIRESGYLSRDDGVVIVWNDAEPDAFVTAVRSGWNPATQAADLDDESDFAAGQFRLVLPRTRPYHFANPWHDILGRFAPKGTGTMLAEGSRSEKAEAMSGLMEGLQTAEAHGDLSSDDVTPIAEVLDELQHELVDGQGPHQPGVDIAAAADQLLEIGTEPAIAVADIISGVDEGRGHVTTGGKKEPEEDSSLLGKKKKAPAAFPHLFFPLSQQRQFQAPTAPAAGPAAATKPPSVLIGLEVKDPSTIKQAGAGLPYLADVPYVALGEIDLRRNELPEYVGMVIDSLEPPAAKSKVNSSLTASNPVRRAMLMDPNGLVEAYEAIKNAVQQSGLKWDDYPFAVQVGDIPVADVKALKGTEIEFGSIIAVLPDGTVIRTGQQAQAQAAPEEEAPMSQMSDKLRAAAAAKRAVVESPGHQFRLVAAKMRAQFAEGDPAAAGIEGDVAVEEAAASGELVITAPDGTEVVIGTFEGDPQAVGDALAGVMLEVADPTMIDATALQAALEAAGVAGTFETDLSSTLTEGGSFEVTVRGAAAEGETDTEMAPAPEFAAAVVDEDEETEGVKVALTDEQLEAEKEKLRQTGKMRSAEWEGLLVVEGVKSGDGRQIELNALTWRELPLPLMMMTKNPMGGDGHDGAELAGRIDWIKRNDAGEIWGGGIIDMGSDAGQEAARLLTPDENGFTMLRGVSVDLDDVEMSFEGGEPFDIVEVGGQMPEMLVSKARVMGATLTPFPAFQEAQVVLVSDNLSLAASLTGEGCDCDMEKTLVASAGRAHPAAQVRTWLPMPFEPIPLVASAGNGAIPVKPPAAWFDCPDFADIRDEPVRITPEGRIFGLCADDKSCHIGFADRCVKTPRSRSGYGYFQNKQVETAEGTMVNTGSIIMDSVHPRLAMQASDAQSFYAHTGSAVADVKAYDTPKGMYIAGALRPTATPEQIRALRGSDISPDWRNIRGSLECVALLAVNTSGFITPALVASGADTAGSVQPGRLAAHVSFETGEIIALVAAGMKVHSTPQPVSSDDVAALRQELELFRLTVQPLVDADLERRRAAAANRFGTRRRELGARHQKAATRFAARR